MVSSQLSLSSLLIRPLAAALLLAFVVASPAPLLAADGDVDLTFGVFGVRTVAFNLGGSFNDYCSGIVAAADGTLFAVGYSESETTDLDWTVAKLTEGVAPLTRRLFFDLGGSRNDRAQAVALDRSGRLLVAGDAANADRNELRVCRLLPGDLSNDPTFNGESCLALDGGAQSEFQVKAVAEAPDLGVLVAGTVGLNHGSGQDFDWFVLKLDAAGVVDISFGLFGIRVLPFNFVSLGHDFLWGMAIDPIDGSIALVGSAQYPEPVGTLGALARLDAAGSLDLSFGFGGMHTWVIPNGNGGYPTVGTAVVRDPIGNDYRVSGFVESSPGIQNLLFLNDFDSSNGPPLGSTVYGWSSGLDLPQGLLLQSDRKLVQPGNSDFGTIFRASRFVVHGSGLLTTDYSFGSAGDAIFDPGGWGTGAGVCAATLDAGRVVLLANFMNPDRDWMVIRLQNASIFVDGFEPGNSLQWSAVQP